MDEILNVVDATQEPVVEVQTTATDDGATAEPQPAQTQETAKPAQSAEENAQFAKIRREAEQRAAETAQQMIDQFYATQYAGQVNPYNGKPIDSESAFREYEQQHQVAQMAEKSGISVQEQQEIIRKAALESPEYQAEVRRRKELERLVDEQTFERDLQSIKAFNPKETAKSIEELGPTFVRARAMGVDTVTAYEIARNEKQRLNPAPPSMGDLNGSAPAQSEYFTREQVSAMSQSEVSKNYDRIRKSMTKW